MSGFLCFIFRARFTVATSFLFVVVVWYRSDQPRHRPRPPGSQCKISTPKGHAISVCPRTTNGPPDRAGVRPQRERRARTVARTAGGKIMHRLSSSVAADHIMHLRGQLAHTIAAVPRRRRTEQARLSGRRSARLATACRRRLATALRGSRRRSPKFGPYYSAEPGPARERASAKPRRWT